MEGPAVPERAKRGSETRDRDWSWVEARVWTERMLAAPVNVRQGSLFEDPQEAQATKWARPMATLDGLNARFGRGTLGFAAEGLGWGWWMRREHPTPAYTTCWASLPVAG